MGIIKVVCGIIIKEGQIFICRRKSGKSLAGYWEFPGGKVEPNEDFKDSLTRELQEELGMSVDVGKHFKSIVHSYENFDIELISFLCSFRSASFTMIDHDLYHWVDPKDLLNWKLAPADVPIAKSITVDCINLRC